MIHPAKDFKIQTKTEGKADEKENLPAQLVLHQQDSCVPVTQERDWLYGPSPTKVTLKHYQSIESLVLKDVQASR